jgi:hypothetical protein
MKRITGALALALVALSSVAIAAPTPADVDEAKRLFERARTATGEGRHAEACADLEKSQALDPSMGTEFYWAECLEKTGKLVAAREHYLHVGEVARASGRTDRTAFAQERLAALEPRLPTVIVDVPEAARVPGLVVEIDGAPLAAARFGNPLRHDPGTLDWSARAPGRAPQAGKVALAESAKATLTIPVLEPASEAGGATTPASTTSIPPDAGDTDDTQRIAGILVGSAGLVGLGVGGVFGALALGAYGDSEDGPCDARNRCTREGLDLRDSADVDATVSTIGFVAGGVLLAGGAVLFFTAPSDEGDATSARIRVRPGSAEVSWRF